MVRRCPTCRRWKAARVYQLAIGKTRVTDFRVLKEIPLQYLQGDFDPKRDAEVLGSIKTLQTINGQPVYNFLHPASRKKP